MELGERIMEEIWALRAKTWEYLTNGYNIDDSDKEKIINKKAKAIKKRVTKRRIIYGNYTDCLFNSEVILTPQQRFKSDLHEVYTEEVNKIALSSNDDKRLKTFDRITTYPHVTNAFKVYEREMMMVKEFFVENYAHCPLYDETVLQS